MTTPDSQDCLVCRKHRGELDEPGGAIYRNDLVRAGHVLIPDGQETAYLGWLMVEPIRHVVGMAELEDEEAKAVGLLATRLSRALKDSEGAEHVYLFVLGHHVPHLHVHIIARYPGTPPEYWGTRVDEWPGAPRGGPEQIANLSARIRGPLST